MFEGLKNLFKKKQGEEIYPPSFLLVTYTKFALEDGTQDDSNKVIIRYFTDKFGNQTEQRYRYSPERLNSLRNTYKIPVYDKTREDIATHRFHGQERLPSGNLTISFGIAVFPEDAEEAGGLIEKADKAMYEAKKRGKNSVVKWADIAE